MSNKPRANDHEAYTSLSLLAFLIAPVGFILGIVYLAKSDTVERKLGEHMIVVSILGFIVFSLFYYLLLPMLLMA